MGLGVAAAFLIPALLDSLVSAPRDVGLYHDDGIYLASATSLHSADYRLINVPMEPRATKYPPLYPASLALADWLGLGAKVPAYLALGVLTTIVLLWLRRVGIAPLLLVVAFVLIVANPALLSHADLVLSDVPFAAICVATVLAAAANDKKGPLRSIAVGLLAASAALTREAGLALIIAYMCLVAFRHGMNSALAFMSTVIVIIVPWWAWRWAAPLDAFPLLSYYLQYERQAWTLAVADPVAVIKVVLANAEFYGRSLGMALGTPGTLLTSVMLLTCARGVVLHRNRPETGFMLAGGAVYVVALLGHPYPMARYLLPVVPFYVIYLVVGISHVRPRAVAALLIAVSCIPTVWWASRWAHFPAELIHGGFGRAMAYSRAGFVETADWIRRCTPPPVAIASAHDPFYFVATGRHAVRPWLHHPYTYTPAYGRYLAERDSVVRVQGDLDRLGVAFLVRDPLLEGGEAEHGRRSIRALLDQQPRAWIPVFATADRQHEVFVRVGHHALIAQSEWCHNGFRAGGATR
jgi:hypothetical protein